MLTQNDLFDLHAVFCNIRLNPSAEYNRLIISRLLAELDTEDNLNDKVRACARGIDNLDKPFWNFAGHTNVYTYTELIKDPKVYDSLRRVFTAMLRNIDGGNFNKVGHIADLCHNIPRDVWQNGGKMPKDALKLLEEID